MAKADKIDKLRKIKHILREASSGIVPINQIALNCYNTKMPIDTVNELADKIRKDLHNEL